MLWTCVCLPALALDILDRGSTDNIPVVVQDGRGQRGRVHSANAAARAFGIHPDMAINAACSLVPALRVFERDETAEYQALKSIAAWAWKYSSRVNLHPPGAVLLEIADSRRLFRNLRRLPEQFQSDLKDLGYQPVVATAPTPLAALLLAVSDGPLSWIQNRDTLPEKLASIPLQYTELATETITALNRAGIHSIEQYAALPRDGLLRRFGPDCLDYLDRLFGHRPDPRTPFRLPDYFDRTLHLPAEVNDVEAVLFAAQRLLRELTAFLCARQCGVQSVNVGLLHPRKGMTRLRLRLVEPTLDEAHLMRLLRERLGRIELEQRVEGIRIRATRLHRLPGISRDLLRPKDTAEPFAHFLERLQARLGRDTVRQLGTCPDHRPEKAWRYCHPGEQADPAVGPRRPFWLLPEPRRLRSQANRPRLAGELRLLAGPERVESGWWDGGDVTRDYFIATDERGGRFWVFRNRRAPHDWYLHGIFA